MPENESRSSRPKLLASDLDGTLIPLDGNRKNAEDLRTIGETIERHQISLAFVTGRHLEIIREAIERHDLPRPEWIIADVGTTIYEADEDRYHTSDDYAEHLRTIVDGWGVDRVAERLRGVEGLRKQEPEKQGRFKLSYYCDAERLPSTVDAIKRELGDEVPYGIISSIDPFVGVGLIDLLPRGVSKARALRWLGEYLELRSEQMVFAGDSGNDLAALTAGYPAIVVGNADADVADQAEQAHREAGHPERLYRAAAVASSGVLEGLRHFLGDSPESSP